MSALGKGVAVFVGGMVGGLFGFYLIDVYKRKVVGIDRERELRLRIARVQRERAAEAATRQRDDRPHKATDSADHKRR